MKNQNKNQNRFLVATLLLAFQLGATQTSYAATRLQPINQSTIQAVMNLQTPMQKLYALLTLVPLGTGYSFDEDTQDAFALALVTLAEETPATSKTKLNELLDKTLTSPLLNIDQQEYVRVDMLGLAPTLPPKPDTTQVQAPTMIDQIKEAQKEKDYTKRIDLLGALAASAENQKFNAPTQDQFGDALVTLYNERQGKSPEELAKLIALLKQARTSTLLDSKQQVYVKKKMLHTLTKKSKPKKRKRKMPIKSKGSARTGRKARKRKKRSMPTARG